MKTLLTQLLIVFAMTSFAQEDVKVRFYVKGAEQYFNILIDGELQPTSNVLQIPAGEHKLQVWAPAHKVFNGDITLSPSLDSTNYFVELEKDEAYIDFLFAKDAYKRKLFVMKTAPWMVAGLGAVMTPIWYVLRNRNHEEYVKKDFQERYNFASTSSRDAAYNRYLTSNTLFYTSAALTVGGLASYFLLKPLVSKMERPVYKQVNPFTLENIELGYQPTLNAPTIGMNLSF